MKTPLPGVTLFPGGKEVPHEKCSLRGKKYPAEWSRYKDSTTGREVIQFTNSPATDQHPYFTGPAVTTAGDRLVFMSDRTGNTNLFSLDLKSGEILQLTDNRYGVLQQYVFPWGNKAGFGKSSVCLNPKTGNVYFMQGRQVRKVNAYTAEQSTIAEIPPGWVTSFTHVSADDSLFCLPIIPEAAFAESAETSIANYAAIGFTRIGDRVRSMKLFSELLVIATDGSSQASWGRQNSWITHVQFCPINNDLILFNNEAIGDMPGGQRMWMCDGSIGKIWKVRPEPENERMWTCHENWTFDGKEILYHGAKLVNGVKHNFFGIVDPSGENYRETLLHLDHVTGYGHFMEHPKRGHVITDGYFHEMKMVVEAWPGKDGFAEFKPICRHDSNWIFQDDHPHPIWSPGAKLIIFSSSAKGVGNVYGVGVE